MNTLPTTSALTATAKSNFNAANNRLITSPTGGLYDAVGNLLRLSGGAGAASVSHDLTYDGENRVVQSNNQGVVTNYVYDGFGRRVQAGGRVFVYFPDGKLAMEVGGAVDDAPTKYLTADHLGSTRIVTRADGTVANRFDYAPYGEELAATLGGRTEAMKYGPLLQPFQVSTKEPRQRFTGHYRDFETGLDYFGARYYSAVGGRFVSPDAPFADQFAEDPQSWNLYGYVRNNPLAYVDEDGNATKEAVQKAWEGTKIVAIKFGEAAPAAAAKASKAAVVFSVLGTAGTLGSLLLASESSLGANSDASKIIAATNAKKQAETDTGKTEETKEEKAAEPAAGGDGNRKKGGRPYSATPENLDRMSKGKAPVGKDGKPVELHHEDQTEEGKVKEMTRQEHRGGDNFKKNHSNTGQRPSKIDRTKFQTFRDRYWKQQATEQKQAKE